MARRRKKKRDKPQVYYHSPLDLFLAKQKAAIEEEKKRLEDLKMIGAHIFVEDCCEWMEQMFEGGRNE